MDRAAIAALRRSHGYTQFLTAATVARLADEMFAVGVVLLILEKTGSPKLAGITIAAATLPPIVSGPVIGAWLDRSGRRSFIYKVDRLLLTAVLVAILAATGNAPDFVIPVLAFTTGMTIPVTSAGFPAMIPLIVEAELLPHANSLEAASMNIALIGGPLLAGIIAGAVSPKAAVVAEIALTLVALLLILRIPDLDRAPAERQLPLRTVVAVGMRHIRHERVLVLANAAQAVNNWGFGVLLIAFPLWAAGDLGAGRSAGGALWAAFSAGSLIGALTLSRVGARIAPEWVIFGGMLVVAGAMFTWPLAGTLVVALALVGVTAVVEGPAIAASLTLRQQRTPGPLLAQVMGTLSSFQIAAFAIGSAVGGPLVVAAGPERCIVIVATTVLVAALIAAGIRAVLPEPALGQGAR